MSHKGIRLLIEETAKKLGDDIQFTYARASDFNLLRDKRYPFISLDLVTANAVFAVDNSYNYSKTWNINMAFYELDKESSDQEEYALILDTTDILVDLFVTKLNFYTQGEYNNIVITTINQTPFVKATADILTGHLLSMQIQVPDNWDYCADGC